MSESRKLRVAFQKGMPSFLAKLKDQVGYQQPELGDKFRSSDDAGRKASKQEDYDVDKAQVVEDQRTKQPDPQPTPTAVATTTITPVPKSFKPSFVAMQKKQRNKAVIEHMKKPPTSKLSSFKMSSQSQEQFEQRIEMQKERLLHEKTKKIFKSNRNLLSFDE